MWNLPASLMFPLAKEGFHCPKAPGYYLGGMAQALMIEA